MTWIYDGNLTNPIEDNAPFKGADGTKYPGNWDRAAVAGMVKVAETSRPDDNLNVVTGSKVEMVNGAPTRAWIYTPRTAEDLKNRANAPIQAQIVAKERLTDRRVREMVLRWAKSALPADDADRTALEAREAEFAALRAQLQ